MRYLLLVLLTLPGACWRPHHGAPTTDATSIAAVGPPTLSRLVPDTLQIVRGNVTTLVLEGRAFSPEENTVTVGPVRLGHVRSENEGRRIVITVPDLVESGGGAAPRPWISGDYPVQVSTAYGTSSPLMVHIN